MHWPGLRRYNPSLSFAETQWHALGDFQSGGTCKCSALPSSVGTSSRDSRSGRLKLSKRSFQRRFDSTNVHNFHDGNKLKSGFRTTARESLTTSLALEVLAIQPQKIRRKMHVSAVRAHPFTWRRRWGVAVPFHGLAVYHSWGRSCNRGAGCCYSGRCKDPKGNSGASGSS
jgi:hypothetical protein